MPFIWNKKRQPEIQNDFSWTNDLRFYDSTGSEINTNNFEQPPNINLYDENGKKIDSSKVEYPEQTLSYNFVDSSATVLELGARYGSVSIIINNKLNSKVNQVSVEPDSTVWNALETNVKANDCSVNIFKGFVSRTPRALLPFGYAATSVPAETSTIPSATVEELETMYSLKFDTLVADCEGFLETFFDENPFLFQQLHTVIFEADFPNKCNYAKIRENLKANEFHELVRGFQNVYKK
jgi:FkbM family methyltransferase